jgi:protein-disulfide isomerase
MKNLPLLLGTILVTLVCIVGIGFLFSSTGSTEAQPADMGILMNQVRNAKGPESAPVTIVEFSDFQCPACLSAEPVVKQIVAKYPDKVRFVYRHLPLTSIHPHAQAAALASEVAADQGKFWELHDELFASQNTWSDMKSSGEFETHLEGVLTKLSIDKKDFLKRMDEPSIRDRVTADVAAATQLGVDATPTFYVNGQPTPAQELMSAVESVLSAAP